MWIRSSPNEYGSHRVYPFQWQVTKKYLPVSLRNHCLPAYDLSPPTVNPKMSFGVVANCLLIISIALVNGMPQRDGTEQEKSESVSRTFLLCYTIVIFHFVLIFFNIWELDLSLIHKSSHLLKEIICNIYHLK